MCLACYEAVSRYSQKTCSWQCRTKEETQVPQPAKCKRTVSRWEGAPPILEEVLVRLCANGDCDKGVLGRATLLRDYKHDDSLSRRNVETDWLAPRDQIWSWPAHRVLDDLLIIRNARARTRQSALAHIGDEGGEYQTGCGSASSLGDVVEETCLMNRPNMVTCALWVSGRNKSAQMKRMAAGMPAP